MVNQVPVGDSLDPRLEEVLRFVMCALFVTTSMAVVLAHDVVQRCKEQISKQNMPLDDLRKKVIYQNTVDIWIEACQEKNQKWNEIQDYKKFIEFLKGHDIAMKKFPLCVSDSESADPEKVKFTENISESKDPDIETFTIKLNDGAIELVRKFDLNL